MKSSDPVLQRIAGRDQSPNVKTAVIVIGITWLITLGVSIPLAFAHHPVMDALALPLGVILLLILLAAPFITVAAAGYLTTQDKQRNETSPGLQTFRAYYLGSLYRLRWLLWLTVGLFPLAIILLFYHAPRLPFAFLPLHNDLLLPFVFLLAMQPLLAAAIGVWWGMRLHNSIAALIVGLLSWLVMWGILLGLDRYQIVRGTPVIIGDTVEIVDVSAWQTAITVLLAINGLAPLVTAILIGIRKRD